MRLDVSDLFDDLFAIATIAYSRYFPTKQPLTAAADFEEWDQFCSDLSDSFFLGLVSKRVYDVTNYHIPVIELKNRIYTHHEWGLQGEHGGHLAYKCPMFFHRKDALCAFAGISIVGSEPATRPYLLRPEHSLVVHLGKQPPAEFRVERSGYDPTDTSPLEYYCQHDYRTMFSGTLTRLYEIRNGWCIRQVILGETLTRLTLENPWWVPTQRFTKIDENTFSRLWDAASESE